MLFTETAVKGAFLVDLERREDPRGWFARAYCVAEFTQQGLETNLAQCNIAYNERAGTVRGFHYQLPPASEAKLLRCISGRIHDVMIDLRPKSTTYLQHIEVCLSASDQQALYVPKMCANAYQTLTDGAEVLYFCSDSYEPKAERGIRYNDPTFGITWPQIVTNLSEKDGDWPDFSK